LLIEHPGKSERCQWKACRNEGENSQANQENKEELLFAEEPEHFSDNGEALFWWVHY
jgi:hypothetical protein